MSTGTNRPKFKKKRVTARWVVCISCDYEYVIEPYAGRPECPACESKEYEDVDHYPLLGVRDDMDGNW